MSIMESFIIMMGLIAALGGGLVLLSCLAGNRARLMKSYNIQRQQEKREQQIQENRRQLNQKKPKTAPPLASKAVSG
ncbi:MAG: hypothetical protein JW810_00010 [Sedimentisphaerales bacterium]|nr:hypothetical protein [Sedimentisphaerales bacterium]